MLKLGRVTKVKVLFLVLVFVFNFDLVKFSAAILEKGLFVQRHKYPSFTRVVSVSSILESHREHC